MLNKGVGEKHRWYYPISSCVIGCGFMVMGLWSMFYPFLQDFFGLETVASIAIGASLLGLGNMIIGPPIAGIIFDKYGPKIPLLLAGIIYLSGFFVLSFMLKTNDWQAGSSLWYIGSFLVGLGMGFFAGTYPPTIAKWFPDRLGTAMGLAVAGAGAGVVVMSPIIGALIANLGFTGMVFTIVGIIGAVIIIVLGAIFWKIPSPGWLPEGWTPQKDALSQATVQEKDYTLGQAAKELRFWLLMVCFLCSAFAAMGFMQNVSMIVQEGLLKGGFAREYIMISVVPLFLSLTGLATTIGGFFWGAVTDKMGGPWRTLPIVYFTSGVMIALFYLGYQSLALIFVFGCLFYFLFGGEPTIHYAIVPHVFGRGKNIGTLMNVMNSFSVGIGIVLGPFLFAYINDISGGYMLALMLAVILRMIATVVVLITSRVSNRMEAQA